MNPINNHPVDIFNLSAIHLLEELGYPSPSELEINHIENTLKRLYRKMPHTHCLTRTKKAHL